MEERKENTGTPKSPGLAALFSALIPGTGYFYIGNGLKGFCYLGAIAALIVMIVNSAEEEMVTNIIIFSLLLSGVYMYQIFDSYNDASKHISRKNYTKEIEAPGEGEAAPSTNNKEYKPSLAGSLIIVFIGLYFQMVTLDYLELNDIDIVFPSIMILIGISILLGRSKKGGN